LLSGVTTGASDLTILTTEHFTLQSARQLCLQDMQNRSTIFMTGLSASLVAIGFLGARRSSAVGSSSSFLLY
jgi:hypothetical protein